MLGFLEYLEEENKRADPNKKERGHLKHLNSEIRRAKKETGEDHVKLEHNGKTYHITHAEKVPGVPKADFKLHDKDGDHIYISHKDLNEKSKQDPAKSYNQLGGVSRFKKHPALKRFAHRVKKRFGTAEGNGTIAMRLRNRNKDESDLVKKALFGHDHGETKERGVNAVHSLVQGKMSLKKHPKRRGVHTIDAPHIMHHNQRLKGNYQVFARTAKSGSSKRSDLGIPNTRVGIGMSDGRKVSHLIKPFEKKTRGK